MTGSAHRGRTFGFARALSMAVTLTATSVFATDAAPRATPSPAASPASRDSRLAVARRIMAAARFASLATTGADGRVQARIVDPLPPDAGMEVYFATNPRSRKVSEIGRDRRVTLLYFDAAAMAYVTLIGDAGPVTGEARDGRYKDEWRGFFPRDAPETWVLYRVRPIRLEIVSAADGLSGDPVTWRPDRVDIR